MTKDKYKLFGRKKTVVPSVNLDLPKVVQPKRTPFAESLPVHKISKLEEPQDPRPEVPILPRINPEPRQAVRQQRVVSVVSAPPVSKVPVTYVASSTKEFFSAAKPLASRPRLRIPEPVLKEVATYVEPLPGSREAKLRAFINKHF
jgi:hypothetical protein